MSYNNIIKDRVCSIDGLHYEQAAIDDDKVTFSLKHILPLLQKSDPTQVSELGRIDVSLLNESEVQDWFQSLELKSKYVNVYWVSFRKGIRIELEIFFRYYSDLWYPSSDDVVVMDEQLTWILMLSHEELFSLWKVN